MMFEKLTNTIRNRFLAYPASSAWNRFALFAEEQNLRKPEPIDPDNMRPLEDSPIEDAYELMFATKPGLPVPHIPISHSAIALKNCKDGSFSVYGRQSPWDFSQWLRYGVTFRTQKDNEKKYLSEGYNFIAYPTGVFFNNQEIKQFLDSADTLINQNQMCNMYRSNCYSYSTTALSFAIEALLERPHFNSIAISRIIDVVEDHPLQDHFSIGVLNNSVVVDKLTAVLSSVQTKTSSLQYPSSADKRLHTQVDLLLTKLKNANQDNSNDSIMNQWMGY